MNTFYEYTINRKTEKIKFCEDRKKGAQKIASEAASRGGAARLTAWHFNSKLPEYDECIKAIKDDKSPEFFKNKMRNYIKAATNTTNQKTFQELLGKAEVFGEIYYEIK
jgi:hypothetical protein